MMDFAFSEEETLIRETATSFALKALRPSDRAHEEGPLGVDVVSSFAGTGLEQLWAPDAEALDGLGPLARCLALEALAGGDAGATVGLLGATWATHAAARLGVAEGDRAGLGFVHLVDDLETAPDAIL
ncbi:MAG: acyl-CoA dehydrogenase family protein, partial [Myxococcota bacterium]|nr:acyl-CoA dehydrogenase family protein [Myxococcota bacterium]